MRRQRREVTHHEHPLLLALRIPRPPQEREHRILRVVRLHPLDPARIPIERVQRPLRPIQVVELPDAQLHARVLLARRHQVPVEAGVVIPLRPRRDLHSHEEQLLPWLREHVREKQSQVRELLPIVAGHLGEQRALQVHDFVVREGHDEMLAVFVQHRERQPIVMKASMDRVEREVCEGVMHPAPCST